MGELPVEDGDQTVLVDEQVAEAEVAVHDMGGRGGGTLTRQPPEPELERRMGVAQPVGELAELVELIGRVEPRARGGIAVDSILDIVDARFEAGRNAIRGARRAVARIVELIVRAHRRVDRPGRRRGEGRAATRIRFARVPAHSELAWLLNGTARMGWLSRMTQFKDKAGKHREGASVGLFVYPVLQAADVLLYQATHVPVGEDQKQHLELARDIAAKFNTDFGVDVFTLPDPIIPKETARIMSLRDGTAKMSKSDPSDMSRVNLADDDDAIAQKIRKAKTDPEPLPDNAQALEGRAEAANLVGIYAALTGMSADAVCLEFAGKGFGAFKPALAGLLVETLRPIRQRFEELKADGAQLDALLERGAAQARGAAAPTLAKAYDALGLMA